MIAGNYEERASRLTLSRTHSIRAFPMTFHTHVELIYVHSGQFTLTVDGHSTVLHPGDLSVCFPHILHQTEHSNADLTLLLFEPSLCIGLLNTLSCVKPVRPFLRKDEVPPLIPELLASLLQRVRGNHNPDDALTSAFLTVLMGELIEHMELTSLPLSELALTQQILTYCMRNYRQDLSPDSVAQALSISRAQLKRTFLRLNLNFRDYLNDLRISAACLLLAQTSLPITDIIYESGFNNQGTFNRLFLKSCGLTPSEYRAAHTDDPISHHPGRVP